MHSLEMNLVPASQGDGRAGRCPLGCPERFADVPDHLAAAHRSFTLAAELLAALAEVARLQAVLERAPWIARADAAQRASPLSRAVLNAWTSPVMHLEALVDAVGERPATVAACLRRLSRQGVVRRVGRRGAWRLASEARADRPSRRVGSPS